ncbi:sugar transferase [Rhodobacterales bacterium HKCCE4037]|nr:sugar transferase [Rhodobacterales bacterium HKCCE4037]
MPDIQSFAVAPRQPAPCVAPTSGTRLFWRAKAVADIAAAVAMLPVIALVGAVLLVLNPVFNPGPLLFRQDRMGRGGAIFAVRKFRTMGCRADPRGPLDPKEVDRIPRLGHILRKTGLDELPQAFNILRGEMSLIGPRPDCARHARLFLETIPEYRQRLSVKPGMSGLAQVTQGYAVGLAATRAKALADADYIARANPRLELWIIWRTVGMVLLARGD